MRVRNSWRAAGLVVAAVAAIAVSAAVATGQQRRFFNEEIVDPTVNNPRYDGRFTFARLKYNTAPGGYYYCGGLPAWAHGYFPCRGGLRAETNLMKIMDELSYLNPHVDDSVVFALDDPGLSKYPVSYMTEPGFWTLTDKEAKAFRAYLLKGGFVIFDDFRPVPY